MENEKKKRKDLLGLNASLQRLHESVSILGSRSISNINVMTQMKESLEILGEARRDLLRSVSMPTNISNIGSNLFLANDYLLGLAGKQAELRSITFDLGKIDKSWLEHINPTENLNTALRSIASIDLAKVAYQATITESLFSKIDFAAIEIMLRRSSVEALTLSTSYFDLTESYKTLIDSFKGLQDFTKLPSSLMINADREVFLSGYVVNSVVAETAFKFEPEEIRQYNDAEIDTAQCVALLGSIDPAFPDVYLGAIETLGGDNPERVRHFLISMRQLVVDLLRKLAPDQEVLRWIPRKTDEYIYNGRPTRRARILYISRNIDNEPYPGFINNNMNAFLSLMEVLNHVHELRPGFSDSQLESIQIRIKSLCMNLIQMKRTN
jgi:hypothetical protein